MVTGRPSIASKIPSKSPCWSGSSSRRGALQLVVLVGEDHAHHRGVALLAEEHVLGPAQADPVRAEAARLAGVLGRVGVGADAQPAVVVAQRRICSKSSPTSGRSAARRRARCSPRAVDGQQVALAQLDVLDPEHPVVHVDLGLGAPVTAGRPSRGATSAACEALPPSLVRIPRAAWKPSMSSASVNGAPGSRGGRRGAWPPRPWPRRRSRPSPRPATRRRRR